MDSKGFLTTVLPEGRIVIARKVDREKDGRRYSTFAHYPIDNIEQAVRVIKHFAGNSDVYYALATYKKGFYRNAKGKKVIRVNENVDRLKALWLDIDLKDGYPDVATAIQDVKDFTKSSGFPSPAIIVHSGNGIHVYWVFEAAVTRSEWLEAAEQFKQAAVVYGLKADHKVTADPCRVLRPPDTLNHKNPQAPKPVKVIYYNSRTCKLSDFIAEGVTGSLPALPDHLRKHAPVDGEFSGGVGRESVASLFADITESCNVCKHVVDTHGKDCSEPEWVAVLQLLKHCEDGALWVHEVSNGHPGYSKQETDEKWQHRLENDSGPTLCSTFALYHPDKCKTCQFNGQIKTPLLLGQGAKANPKTGVVITTWRPAKNGRGMERKMLDPETGQSEWVKVLHRVISDVEATRSVVTRHYEMRFNASYENDTIEIVLPSGHLGNQPKLRETMASFGVPLRATETNPFIELMATWLEKLQANKQVEDVTEQLGWIQSGDDEDKPVIGFSAGSVSYYKDGTVRKGVRVSKEFQTIGSMYEPVGQLQPWKDVAKFLTDQDNPAFTAILASAFAAPLMKFTGVQGGILSIVSTESGVGKTSAMRCAQAVWGSPSKGMNSVDDTRLSVARKLGFINNLPAYWDELRGHKTMEDFLTLAFQISQGKEKTRLDSTATMREVQTWETMLIAASNESIFDAMGAYTGASDAGVARTFELTVTPFSTMKSRAEISMMFDMLNNNYGRAGQVYAKYLANNLDWVIARTEMTFTRIAGLVDMRAAERFWVAIVAVLVTGAELAEKAGLAKINRKTLLSYLCDNIYSLRGKAVDTLSSTEPREVFAAYIQQHQDRMLVVDKLPASKQNTSTYLPEIVIPPRMDKIRIHSERDGNKVRISQGDFARWLKTRGLRYNAMKTAMQQHMGMVERKTRLGIGTKWELPPQRVLEFVVPSLGGTTVSGDADE